MLLPTSERCIPASSANACGWAGRLCQWQCVARMDAQPWRSPDTARQYIPHDVAGAKPFTALSCLHADVLARSTWLRVDTWIHATLRNAKSLHVLLQSERWRPTCTSWDMRCRRSVAVASEILQRDLKLLETPLSPCKQLVSACSPRLCQVFVRGSD